MRCLSPLTLLVAALLLLPPASAQAVKPYPTRYYVLHTDLGSDAVREATLRMTLMAEEYHARTQGFAGAIRSRQPFYLFGNPQLYYAAGGVPGSAGVFTGDRLMALATENMGDGVWRVVQHEGFHQFLHAVVGGEIPIWVNEGLADYFGEAIFTGQGYVTGVVPPERLSRVKDWIKQRKTKRIAEMMVLSHAEWNAELSLVNYDQAWSMIHFLAHAESGKYQKPFNAFMQAVSGGKEPRAAWDAAFGRGTAAFEQKWRNYWEAMESDASRTLYARSSVETLTAFYARAFAQRQKFETAEAFFTSAAQGQLKCNPQDWLPPSLLMRELARAGELGGWSVERNPGRWALVCETKHGERLIGTFVLNGTRVSEVNVTVSAK